MVSRTHVLSCLCSAMFCGLELPPVGSPCGCKLAPRILDIKPRPLTSSVQKHKGTMPSCDSLRMRTTFPGPPEIISLWLLGQSESVSLPNPIMTMTPACYHPQPRSYLCPSEEDRVIITFGSREKMVDTWKKSRAWSGSYFSYRVLVVFESTEVQGPELRGPEFKILF